jgi:hypothetical protein
VRSVRGRGRKQENTIPEHETETRRDESSRGGPACRREGTSAAARLMRGLSMGKWVSWAPCRGVENKGGWAARRPWRAVEDKGDEREMGTGTRR